MHQGLIRSTIAGITLVAVIICSSQANAQEKRFDGVTLRVGTYGGSWRDLIQKLIGAELERRGAKIEYVVGNPRDNLAKLIAARGQTPPFDVIELTDSVKTDAVGSGFLQPIEFDHIPNAKVLDPKYHNPVTVGTWVSVEGLVYNAEKYKELGLPAPTKFGDLFDPKLAGHVSFPDIHYGGVVNGLIGFAWEFAGGDERNIDVGLEWVKKLKPASYYKSSVDLSAQFKSGDIWAAVWHAGWALRMNRAGLPLATAYPKIKDKVGMIQLGWIGIIKGTKQAEAAEFFINRYLDATVQKELADQNGVVPLNAEAAKDLASDPLLRKLMLVTPQEIADAYYADWSLVSMSALGDKWNRMIAQ
jgi:putative spermidine/putrescine transport system substrate-binding protein